MFSLVPIAFSLAVALVPPQAAVDAVPTVQAASGNIPLNDLGTGLYRGIYQGGLYPGGLNTPPKAHRQAARRAALAVVPRDANGLPDSDGRIGFLAVSMSNANQQWSAFKRSADLDGHRNSRVALVSGAQGGQSLDVIADPQALYWSELERRVEVAGLTPQQVQVVWLKMADAAPLTLRFPHHAGNLMDNAQSVLHILKSTYPNLQLAYFSSRSYGGYSSVPDRSEPLSYETGFATKWLIEDQINGNPDLNHDSARGLVLAPVIMWGPYLWADGTNPRSDGLRWLPSDFEPDFVHPSSSGEQKVAAMLDDFFNSAASATPWYGQPSAERLVVLDAMADASVISSKPNRNFGTSAYLQADAGGRRAYIKFDISDISGTIEHAELSFVAPPAVLSERGTEVSRTSSVWSENSITYNSAPPTNGHAIATLPSVSRGTALSVDVTTEVLRSIGGQVAFALTSAQQAGHLKLFLSRESGEGPRLVLTVLPPCDDPGVSYCHPEPNSTGLPALLSASGSSSIAADDLVLDVDQLPPGEHAVLYFGFQPLAFPLGDGILCVDQPFGAQSPTLVASATGSVSYAVDFGRLPLALGQTVYVQCIYRDAGGLAGFNFSDGLRLDLWP
jgi:hypothetical protein